MVCRQAKDLHSVRGLDLKGRYLREVGPVMMFIAVLGTIVYERRRVSAKGSPL